MHQPFISAANDALGAPQLHNWGTGGGWESCAFRAARRSAAARPPIHFTSSEPQCSVAPSNLTCSPQKVAKQCCFFALRSDGVRLAAAADRAQHKHKTSRGGRSGPLSDR